MLVAMASGALVLVGLRCGDGGQEPPPPPPTPSNLVATPVRSVEIDLSWTDNSSDEAGFRLERCTGAGCTSFVEIARLGANVTSYQDGAIQELYLTPSTSYSYRVLAYNAAGNSAYSNTATATTLPTVPAAPSGLAATAVSASQVNLAWTDNASNEDGVRIERCTGASCTSFAEIATVGANVTSYQNTGRTASTSYTYRVRAYNTAGVSAYSSSATAVTPPLAPTGLTATPVSTTRVDLSWTDNASDEGGFRIERAPGGTSSFTEIATVGANVTTYPSTGLNSGTAYSYRVRAYSAAGNSDFSSTATATTRPDRIAFASDRDGNEEIYVMNGDGSGVTRLTHDPAADGNPVWSPDGTRIAFVSLRSTYPHIYVMNADGSGVVQRTYGSASDYNPTWSPDGARIAFRSNFQGNEEIYVMNADGGGIVRLTKDAAFDGSPAWSPDGTRIAFVSDRDTDERGWERCDERDEHERELGEHAELAAMTPQQLLLLEGHDPVGAATPGTSRKTPSPADRSRASP
ncbi:MAG: fibronectin type III domain-containing protein [Gemmatimonadales bacterium]